MSATYFDARIRVCRLASSSLAQGEVVCTCTSTGFLLCLFYFAYSSIDIYSVYSLYPNRMLRMPPTTSPSRAMLIDEGSKTNNTTSKSTQLFTEKIFTLRTYIMLKQYEWIVLCC